MFKFSKSNGGVFVKYLLTDRPIHTEIFPAENQPEINSKKLITAPFVSIGCRGCNQLPTL